MTHVESRLRRAFVWTLAWALVACATSASHAKPPDWVLNPPNDSTDEYWGVGDGYALDTARRTALRSVAAKLRVSISGVMESETRVRNNTVDRSAQSRVSEVVQETEFSNVSVEKNAKHKDGFYVLVKVDRRAFIKETQAKFDSLNRAVQDELMAIDQLIPIEQFRKLVTSAPLIEQSITLGLLLRVADPSFADAERLRKLEGQGQMAATAAKRLVVSIQNEPNDSDVRRIVTSFLNAQGVRVSLSEPSLVLRIATTVKEDVLFGSKSHQLNVALQLVDDKGQTIASKQYRSNGNSLDSHTLARQDAVNKLLNAMNAAGVVSGLGL